MQKPQSELLAEYKTILSNAQHHPLISAAISPIGYDATKISEGISLLNETKAAYVNCIKTNETKADHLHSYTNKRKAVSDLFRAHRKSIKKCCDAGCETCASILISSKVPKNHIKWVKMMRQFYTTMQDKTIIKHISKTHLTQATAKECCIAIDAMEKSKATYEASKTEALQITRRKLSDMNAMAKWMSKFKACAAPALEGNVMHLSAIGIK